NKDNDNKDSDNKDSDNKDSDNKDNDDQMRDNNVSDNQDNDEIVRKSEKVLRNVVGDLKWIKNILEETVQRLEKEKNEWVERKKKYEIILNDTIVYDSTP